MTKVKLPLAAAEEIARELIEKLSPCCERIEVAGSVRRRAAEVGDIEIVGITRPIIDLFGEPLERTELDWWLDSAVPRGDISKNGPRYKQFLWRGTQIDLFLATPENYGLILMLRTGDVEFSHRMVTLAAWGGLKPAETQVREGRVWRDGICVAVPDEATLFSLWGMDYIPPTQRSMIW